MTKFKRKSPPYMYRGTNPLYGEVWSNQRYEDTPHLSFVKCGKAFVGWDYDRNRWVCRPIKEIDHRLKIGWRKEAFK